jgi:uncharacterized protein (TIGR03118 family)
MAGTTRYLTVGASLGLALGLGLFAVAAARAADADADDIVTFTQTNLDSNVPGAAKFTDPHLLNSWGLAFFPDSPFWVNNNNGGTSTLYDGNGTIVPLVVTIPGPAGSPANFVSSPTGIVWNPTDATPTSFAVTSGGVSASAIFIFDSEDGVISGWNPGVNLTHAIVAVDNHAAGAIYKGLAFGTANGNGNNIYATNFHAGTVDVFDSNFKPVMTAGGFVDKAIPAGFAPFGIQNINGELWVTYAKQDAAKANDVPGVGNGFVDVFDTDGNLIRRFAARGVLDSPWGVARAPFSFGQFAGDILIGNLEDGFINVFDNHGIFLGPLRTANGKALVIPGLWALSPGGGANSTPENLYFTAGPKNQTDGLFGFISAVPVSDRD